MRRCSKRQTDLGMTVGMGEGPINRFMGRVEYSVGLRGNIFVM